MDRIAPEAMAALLRWPWPGNVRELRNAMQYAFATGRGPELLAGELPPELLAVEQDGIERPALADSLSGRASASPLVDLRLHRQMSDAVQRQTIVRALAVANWHLGDAAGLLGVSAATLWRKRRKLGISAD